MYLYSLNYRVETPENPYGRKKITEMSTPWLPRAGEIVEYQPWEADTGTYHVKKYVVETVEYWYQDETRYGINVFVKDL